MILTGAGFIGYSFNSFSCNLLGNGAAAPQHYTGERPTFSGTEQLVATYDLHSLGLRNAQLVIAGVLTQTSWGPLGPRAIRVSRLSYYQSLRNGQMEVQGGYLANDVEWIGISVAGSLVSGTLGINAIIPFEVGVSRLPLTAPGISVRVNAARGLYAKAGLQRSLNPDGPDVDAHSDRVGLRFHRAGDGLLQIGEAGWKIHSAPTHRSAWIRAGELYNTSRYTRYDGPPGSRSDNNWAVFAAWDLQLSRYDSGPRSYRGLYGGLSYNCAPPAHNNYSQYYEARLYSLGPFQKRPGDLASVVLSDTQFSPPGQALVTRSGATAYDGSLSLTASYGLRVRPGVYLNGALGVTDHPAFSPRLPEALNAQLQLNMLF